ncbi:hypothetical protein TNCV_2554371 [Trichonephila clavipes]|nr:hypothetical protein TNCV_2554371 [Trichonephila clavipes]
MSTPVWDIHIFRNSTTLRESDRGSRNSPRQRARCTHAVSRNFLYHSGDSTIWLGSTPILRENILEVAKELNSYSLLSTSPEDFWLDGYLECRKDTAHLQIPLLSLEFESRPFGTAVSVTNNCTRWATRNRFIIV